MDVWIASRDFGLDKVAILHFAVLAIIVIFVLYLGKMYKPMRDLSKMTDTTARSMTSIY